MSQTKVVDFVTYREQIKSDESPSIETYPEDLITAIQILIRRLRESKPISHEI